MSKDEGKGHAKEEHEDKAHHAGGAESEGGGAGEEGSLEASFAESKKKGKKKKIIIAAAALVVLLAGGGAGAYFGGVFGHKAPATEGAATEGDSTDAHGEKKESKDAHGSESKDAHGGKEDAHGAGKPTFFQLGDILVNLSGDSKRPNFLKISITLELASEKDSAEMTIIKPRVIDNFQVYLRELRVEDLRGSAGLYRLREELLLRINEVASPIRVRDVLFQELLVQ